jgi:hypothetical protein
MAGRSAAPADLRQTIEILLRTGGMADAQALEALLRTMDMQMQHFTQTARAQGVSIEEITEKTREMAAEYQRARAALDEMNHQLGNSNISLIEQEKRSQAAARGMVEFSRGIEDLTTGGPLGILNNIPGMLDGITRSLGLSAAAMGGLVTVVTLAATAAFTLWTHWSKIDKFFNDHSTDTVAQEMERLEKATARTANEQARYNDLKERQKAIEDSGKITTPEQDAAAKIFKERAKLAGGSSVVQGAVAASLGTGEDSLPQGLSSTLGFWDSPVGATGDSYADYVREKRNAEAAQKRIDDEKKSGTYDAAARYDLMKAKGHMEVYREDLEKARALKATEITGAAMQGLPGAMGAMRGRLPAGAVRDAFAGATPEEQKQQEIEDQESEAREEEINQRIDAIKRRNANRKASKVATDEAVKAMSEGEPEIVHDLTTRMSMVAGNPDLTPAQKRSQLQALMARANGLTDPNLTKVQDAFNRAMQSIHRADVNAGKGAAKKAETAAHAAAKKLLPGFKETLQAEMLANDAALNQISQTGMGGVARSQAEAEQFNAMGIPFALHPNFLAQSQQARIGFDLRRGGQDPRLARGIQEQAQTGLGERITKLGAHQTTGMNGLADNQALIGNLLGQVTQEQAKANMKIQGVQQQLRRRAPAAQPRGNATFPVTGPNGP